MVFRVTGGQIVPVNYLPIVNDVNESVTGLPNGPADDAKGYRHLSRPPPPVEAPLPYNQDGLDTEDIHTLPGGGFILVEEYSSSVVIVSDTGNVLKRYTPAGKTLAAVEFTPGVTTPAANYSVSDSLPAVLKQRRANRGFESIAVSDDGTDGLHRDAKPHGRDQRAAARIATRDWCASSAWTSAIPWTCR